MPGKHNAGGCGCCESDICCPEYTAITISGLANASCTTGCDDRNGTWAYRSLGDPVSPSSGLCSYFVPLFDYESDCDPIYIGGSPCVTGRNGASVIFDNSIFGQVTCTVFIQLIYIVYHGGGTSSITGYQATFRDTKPTCSAFTTLPFLLGGIGSIASGGACNADGADTGDLCNLLGATVGLA